MHEYIENAVDVTGDGHCGFHTIAGLRDMIVDDYQMIHFQLQKELNNEEIECYRRLLGRTINSTRCCTF